MYTYECGDGSDGKALVENIACEGDIECRSVIRRRPVQQRRFDVISMLYISI